jgi:aspartate racemase
MKRIGIIGGLGPRASANFYRLLLDYCSKKFNAAFDSDFPSVVLFSLSSSGMTETGIIDETVLIPDLHKAFDCFREADVEVIAIACNSVFHYYDKIIKQTKANIINLIDETASYLFTHSIKNVSILGSRGITNSKVFEPYLSKASIVPHYPDRSTQNKIDSWIFDVMAGNFDFHTKTSFQKVIDEQLEVSDAVLIACSELAVLIDPFLLPERVFDTMFILAKCTLDFAMV